MPTPTYMQRRKDGMLFPFNQDSYDLHPERFVLFYGKQLPRGPMPVMDAPDPLGQGQITLPPFADDTPDVPDLIPVPGPVLPDGPPVPPAPAVPAATATAIALDQMSKKDLIAFAKTEYGITLGPEMSKGEMIQSVLSGGVQ